MDLDAFVSDIMSFPEGDYNENATLLVNGTVYYPGGTNGNGWTNIVDPNAFQGSYKITNVTRSGFRINFSGDSIRWFFPRRSDLGKVAVTFDGEDLGIHDPNTEPNITDYYWSGLGSGVHIMTVTNTGQTTSTGTVLAWDRFQVGEQTTYDRVKASSYGDGWAHSRNTFWFGDLSPNDCANFTSQIQYKGGFGMHPSEDWLKNPIDLTQWWNNYPYNASISYSWKTVPDFYTYASNRPEYEIRDNPGYTRRGDLMLLDVDYNFILDHMKVIAGNGFISPYSSDYANRIPGEIDRSGTLSFKLMTSAHTQDRWHVPLCFSYDCENSYTQYIRIVP